MDRFQESSIGRCQKLKFQKDYICDACPCVFIIYASKLNRKPSCPICGESMDVRRYEAKRCDESKSLKSRWTSHEEDLAKKCLTGELLPYQVAILLGRSINSVTQKVRRMRNEKG